MSNRTAQTILSIGAGLINPWLGAAVNAGFGAEQGGLQGALLGGVGSLAGGALGKTLGGMGSKLGGLADDVLGSGVADGISQIAPTALDAVDDLVITAPTTSALETALGAGGSALGGSLGAEAKPQAEALDPSKAGIGPMPSSIRAPMSANVAEPVVDRGLGSQVGEIAGKQLGGGLVDAAASSLGPTPGATPVPAAGGGTPSAAGPTAPGAGGLNISNSTAPQIYPWAVYTRQRA